MRVLIDSSVWIDFFRRTSPANRLPSLLTEDLAVVNELVMAEIVPALKVKRDKKTIALLELLISYPINIDWNEIIDLQARFVKEFKYFAGIADLIIFQNACQNDLVMYSFDRDMIGLCKLNKHSFLE